MPPAKKKPPAEKAGTGYMNRVKGLAWLPGERVERAPNNWRTHDERQRKVLRGLLAEVGVAGAVLAWVPDDSARAALRLVPTGDAKAFLAWLEAHPVPVRLIDGHMRRDEIRQMQPVLVTDLDEAEAKKALATFDPVGDLAGRDDSLLAELLADVGTPDQAGTADLLDELQKLVGASAGSGSAPGGGVHPGGDAYASVEVTDLRAPFPWFGGKTRAAPIIWGALGDVANFVEPFFGSGAVLLARPGGPGKIETVNDLDAWVACFWRAVAADPEGVARYADHPVNEADLHARHGWLIKQEDWRRKMLDHADPEYFDAKIAGWWVWGLCAWIGSGWCAMRDGGPSEQIPHLSGTGQVVHRLARSGPDEGRQVAGLSEKLPMLAHGARVNPASSVGRTPSEQLPHLGNAGRGVHRVHDGPSEQLPHLGGTGMDSAPGVHSGAISANVRDIMQRLQDRLRRVRVACGDWERVLSPAVTTGHGLTGIVLDPPYAEGADDLYGNHDKSISARVKAWAIAHGDDPLLRIAFCGYDGEHGDWPANWRTVHWKAQGGYGLGNGNPYRERIWLSPHCLEPAS